MTDPVARSLRALVASLVLATPVALTGLTGLAVAAPPALADPARPGATPTAGTPTGTPTPSTSPTSSSSPGPSGSPTPSPTGPSPSATSPAPTGSPSAPTQPVEPVPIPSSPVTTPPTPGPTTNPATRVDDSPLKVTIDQLSPGYLPTTGRVTIAGTVTNRSRETWSSITVYPFFGAAQGPMRSAAQLARAAATPYDAYVGNRIVQPTSDPGTIDSLPPGASARYTTTVPASALVTSGPGAYWFGVQALDHRDNSADGIARTFLPYVPDRVSGSLPTALVLPLTRDISFADDGSVDDPARWQSSLSSGRIRDVVDFGAAATAPLTWLVDPALLDTAALLAAGNPARSLDSGDSGDTGTGGSPSPSASPTGTPSSPSGSPSPSGLTTNPFARPSASAGSASGTTATATDPTTVAAASAATTWLRAFSDAVEGNGNRDQVLTLPYGNLDVPAALRHEPALYDLALTTKSPVLAALGLSTTPALASPGGYVDAASVAAARGSGAVPRATVLATDKMFPRPRPGLATVGGQPVVVASSGAASGGPGPGPAVTTIGLRQRILAEAAVRLLKRSPSPLTVVLPTQWGLGGADTFFSGLEAAPWLDLTTVDQLEAGSMSTTVDPERLDYPALQLRRELDRSTVGAAQHLVRLGGLLAGVLTRRGDVASQLTREALVGASYPMRSTQSADRVGLQTSTQWVHDQLDAVEVSAPRGVTLSGASGKFAATLTNRLDVPVTVGVRATSDAGIAISQADDVQLGPRSHTTVLLEATSTTNKVHNVVLHVVDAQGRRLGPSDTLPIRSAQVSNVIWVIMGVGAALLFGAIAMRLVRRIRRARRTATVGGA